MSTLRLTTISNQSGSSSVPSDTVISGSAKAWVNFNGTGTVAIRASFNVSSITDGGVGIYTVNLTTAMLDINFVTNVTADGLSAGYIGTMFSTSITSSVIPVRAINQAGSAADSVTVNVSIFR